MKNKEKMNNKGFSLVELIIVIAIMAVLVAVLAPQYMKFVERGRAASDRDNVDAIAGALTVYAVDPDSAKTLKKDTTITIKSDSVAIDDKSGADKAVEDALKSAGLPYKQLAAGGTKDQDTIPTLTNKETFSQVVIKVEEDAAGFLKVTTTETAIP